jgi:hypothetical protein
LRAAIVKLRDALHPDLGLKACDRRDLDLLPLRQILAFLEAEVERRHGDINGRMDERQ